MSRDVDRSAIVVIGRAHAAHALGAVKRSPSGRRQVAAKRRLTGAGRRSYEEAWQ
jgi:hypothetical protein